MTDAVGFGIDPPPQVSEERRGTGTARAGLGISKSAYLKSAYLPALTLILQAGVGSTLGMVIFRIPFS